MQLRNYQNTAIQFGLEKDRSVLALDCGLGKSLCALEVADKVSELRKVNYGVWLVVVPASLVLNWYNEIEKWGMNKHRFLIRSYNKYITDLKSGELNVHGFDGVIFDEVHAHLRNQGTLRVKTTDAALKGFKGKVIFLTGTPIVRGAGDIYNLLVWCGLFTRHQVPYDRFCEKHCRRKVNPFRKRKFDYVGVNDWGKLRKVFNKIGVSFKKKDVEAELPVRLEQVVELDCGDFRLSETEKAELWAWMQGKKIKGLKRPKHLSERQLEVSHHKLRVLSEMYEGLEKAVFFTWYKQTARDLGKALGCDVITGDMTIKKRQELIDKFQSGEISRLVATGCSIGTGFNLYNGEYVVFAEFPWTWSEAEQWLSRVERIGNKKCTVVYPVAMRSIEEIIWKGLVERKGLSTII